MGPALPQEGTLQTADLPGQEAGSLNGGRQPPLAGALGRSLVLALISLQD